MAGFIEQLEKDFDKFSKEVRKKAYMDSVRIINKKSISPFPRASFRNLVSFQHYHDHARITKKWKRHAGTRPPAHMNTMITRTARNSSVSHGWIVSKFSHKQELTAFIRASGHRLYQGLRGGGRRGFTWVYVSVQEGQFTRAQNRALQEFESALDKNVDRNFNHYL